MSAQEARADDEHSTDARLWLRRGLARAFLSAAATEAVAEAGGGLMARSCTEPLKLLLALVRPLIGVCALIG
jgi:hypothetical protein